MFSDKVENFIDLLDLRKLANFYWAFNTAKDLPYHNSLHVDYMMTDFINLLSFNEDFIHSEGIKHIAAAILMHDFNHSGGALADEENIRNALDGVKTFYDLYAGYQHGEGRDNHYITNIIKYTQYPYVIFDGLDDRHILCHNIIRDLDCMSIYHVLGTDRRNALKQFYGLHEEMTQGKCDQTSYIKDFIPGNTKWLNAIEWRTLYGQHMAKEVLPLALKIFNNEQNYKGVFNG